VRIGLIGLGVAGQRHAAAFKKIDDVVIAAAADPAPAALPVASGLDVQLYPGYEEMIAAGALDAVVISLPHSMLAEAAVTCARRGLHLLVEKPMALTVRDADAVIEAARAARVRLMVNFVHRFRAEYRAAKGLIEDGVIGRPAVIVDSMTSGRSLMPGWVWEPAISGGGMMMYNGVHSIDRLAWLAGSSIRRVGGAAGTFSYPVEVEDNLVGVLEFANGTFGVAVQHKSAATVTLGAWDTTIWGTKGAIKISGGVLEVASDKERARTEVKEDDRFLGAAREFLAAIRDGRDPSPGGEDGRRALEAVLGLYEAAAGGRTVDLPGR
jgi:predicted dehydrogenase